MTVVVVGEVDVRQDASAVTARLAELAINDELLVVCGSNDRRPRPSAHTVVTGLRDHLPRHHVVAVHVASNSGALRRDAAVLDEFLEIGSLPVVLTLDAVALDVAAELSNRLRADRILKVSCTTGGADLEQVWPRRVSTGNQLACLAR
jgi:hypothetical protein